MSHAKVSAARDNLDLSTASQTQVEEVELEKISTALIGAAGEHLVLSRLLAKGALAAQAPRGVKKADILVNFLDGGEPSLIQVKASRFGPVNGWHMSEKHESIQDDDLYYCFVDFSISHPNVYVIPASIVSKVLKRDHETWLATPGRKGQQHNDSSMRRLRSVSYGEKEGWLESYLERWDLVLKDKKF